MGWLSGPKGVNDGRGHDKLIAKRNRHNISTNTDLYFLTYVKDPWLQM